jgi:hypothetical protein
MSQHCTTVSIVPISQTTSNKDKELFNYMNIMFAFSNITVIIKFHSTDPLPSIFEDVPNFGAFLGKSEENIFGGGGF